MKFGVIGLKFGKNYIKNINEIKDSETVMLCSKTAQSYNDLIVRPRGMHFWTDKYQYVCDHPEVETVVVATDPGNHYEIVKYALNAGKNVICEKPFVFKTDEASELIQLSMTKKRHLIINYIHTWQPNYRLLKDKFKSVENKNIQLFGAGFGPFRDYNALWDWGSHDIALAIDFFENIPIQSGIEFSNITGLFNVGLQFPNGVASIQTGNTSFIRRRDFSVSDAQGNITIWQDDKSSNPLMIMLTEFIEGIKEGFYMNNSGLGLAVTRVLEKLSS